MPKMGPHTKALNVSFTDTKLAILKIIVTSATSGESAEVEGAGSEIQAENGDLTK